MSSPIQPRDAWAAWCAEADRLGLHRGERGRLDTLMVGVPPSPAGLERVIVERTRQARLQRPLYRLEGLTICLDPLGRVDNMAAVRAELHDRAVEAHRAAILADVRRQLAEGRTLAAAARSWNRHPKTLARWEKGQNSLAMSREMPQNRGILGPSRAFPSRARLASPSKPDRSVA